MRDIKYLITNDTNILSIIIKELKRNKNNNILLKLMKHIYEFNQKRSYDEYIVYYFIECFWIHSLFHIPLKHKIFQIKSL